MKSYENRISLISARERKKVKHEVEEIQFTETYSAMLNWQQSRFFAVVSDSVGWTPTWGFLNSFRTRRDWNCWITSWIIYNKVKHSFEIKMIAGKDERKVCFVIRLGGALRVETEELEMRHKLRSFMIQMCMRRVVVCVLKGLENLNFVKAPKASLKFLIAQLNGDV